MRDLQSRRSRRAGAFVVFAALCAMATAEPLAAQPICPPTSGAGNPNVLTGQNDNNRDAYNGSETCLYSTGSALSVTLAEASFSPLLVDTPSGSGIAGYNPIYAQPLYVPNIAVQHPAHGTCSPTCNMVVIATAYGSIFAYNTDNGNLLWSRTGTGGTPGTNWLWYDDCGSTGEVVGLVTPTRDNYIGPGLPFAGIVSTPVIDTNPPTTSPQYTATMFLTSVCQTSGNLQPQWWLHEIDLAGLASGADVAGKDISTVQINPTSGSITFNAPNQLQRPALLEIKVPNAAPNPLIYVGLGVAGSEITAGNPYHGWLLGYTINSSSALVATPSLTFVATPTSCGTGGGIGSQCPPQAIVERRPATAWSIAPRIIMPRIGAAWEAAYGCRAGVRPPGPIRTTSRTHSSPPATAGSRIAVRPTWETVSWISTSRRPACPPAPRISSLHLEAPRIAGKPTHACQ